MILKNEDFTMTSAVSNEYLNQTRRKLVAALGNEKDNYFFHMKRWFRMKVTKEDFDSSARALLPADSVHLHNEFLLAILTKCQIFSSPVVNSTPSFVPARTEESSFDKLRLETPVSTMATQMNHNFVSNNHNTNERKKMRPKRKTKVVSLPVENNFEAVNLQDVTPTANLREPAALTDANPGYYARSLQLLDTGPLKGRLLIAAWDHGLSTFNEQVALLLQEAARLMLKTIVTSVISRRKGYRLRENSFKYGLGTLPANPWLRNAASLNDWTSESLGLPLNDIDVGQRPTWPTVDAAEQNAAHLASCGPVYDPPLAPVSAFDLFTTLLDEKSIIPNHTVYSLSMERISSRLWHPSRTEIESTRFHIKENKGFT